MRTKFFISSTLAVVLGMLLGLTGLPSSAYTNTFGLRFELAPTAAEQGSSPKLTSGWHYSAGANSPALDWAGPDKNVFLRGWGFHSSGTVTKAYVLSYAEQSQGYCTRTRLDIYSSDEYLGVGYYAGTVNLTHVARNSTLTTIPLALSNTSLGTWNNVSVGTMVNTEPDTRCGPTSFTAPHVHEQLDMTNKQGHSASGYWNRNTNGAWAPKPDPTQNPYPPYPEDPYYLSTVPGEAMCPTDNCGTYKNDDRNNWVAKLHF